MNRGTLISLVGLVIGIVGLLIQWIANPVRFGGFPPGIAFIAAAGVLTLVTARWWWHAVFAVLIGVWIVGVGSLANQMQPNLVSPIPGTVGGTIVMAVGLILSVVAGVASMVSALRTRSASHDRARQALSEPPETGQFSR